MLHQVKARNKRVCDIIGTKLISNDGREFLDIAGAGPIEIARRQIRHRSHGMTAGSNPDAGLLAPRVGREVQHAVERDVQSGQNQQVRPGNQ